MQPAHDRGAANGKSKALRQTPQSGSAQPSKRHKGCIKYYLKPIGDAAAQASGSANDDLPLQEALPNRTPAVPAQGSKDAGTAACSVLPTAPTYPSMSPMLRSLQRRFDQSQLYTPAVAHDKSSQQDQDLEGFVLHSQPAYERVLSQRLPSAAQLPPSSSQFPSDTQFDDAVLPCPAPCAASPASSDGQEAGSQHGPAHPVPDAAQPVSAPAARQGVTPAVHSADRVAVRIDSADSMFPIFRSKKDCKVVYIVRHGESEYNAASSARGSAWADPQIFDAPLTSKGKHQCLELREKIAQWNLPADTLWVTSPLTRAIQTMLLGWPELKPLLVQEGGGVGRVHVLPEISETVCTSGDIGRPPGMLCQRFPELSACLQTLPELWWYTDPANPASNCALRRQFQAHEPKEHLRRRVTLFRKWLLARPEKVIVAFGHSCFWKEFSTACNNGVKAKPLANCGWEKIHV